jgi:hypothetical protein
MCVTDGMLMVSATQQENGHADSAGDSPSGAAADTGTGIGEKDLAAGIADTPDGMSVTGSGDGIVAPDCSRAA